MVQDIMHGNISKPFFGSLLEQVSYTWPSGEIVLNKCNLTIPHPGLWMIVGSNGSGKSTLFRLISGMLTPQSGKISTSVKSSLMFQNPDHQILLPSCGSDLLLSLPEDLSINEKRECIAKVLYDVGLEGMQLRPIHTLSGGQKQRLALAGALASQANLLLLDEPTALLDPISQKAVLALVQKLCKPSESAVSSLWITHRLEELQFCDGAALMEGGQVGEWMSGEKLMKHLQLLAVRRV